MEIKNTIPITIDFRKPSKIPMPQVNQYDTNEFEFTVLNSGQPADLSTADRIVANYRRPDKSVITREITAEANVITYPMGSEEMAVEGMGELNVQLFAADRRLSSMAMKVYVHKNLGAAFEGGEGLPLLQDLFVEVAGLVEDTQTNANYALNQGDYAKEQADIAAAESANLSQLKTDAESATTAANEAAGLANTNAQEAGTQGAYAKEQGDYANAEYLRLKDTDVSTLSAQLAENVSVIKENPLRGMMSFLDYLRSGQVTKIKLIGDSITEGVGATNHSVPTDNPIIFDDGAGTIFREGCYTCKCWANSFRNFIQGSHPTIQFINAGIGGKSAKWANQNKDHWVGDNEDVVFVQLGTNDRQGSTTVGEFETNLTQFLEYVDARSNKMVVMTASPTLNDYDESGVKNPAYYFDMGEVDKTITKVCTEKGYTHISNYRLLLEHARNTKTPLSKLLQTYQYGSHPVDAGYEAMWRNMQQQLGLIDDIRKWTDLSDKTTLVGDAVTPTTPITDPMFGTRGLMYYAEIGGSHPNISGFAESNPGLLITYRGNHDLYSWQRYIVRGTTRQHMRIWNFGANAWGEWQDSSSVYNLIKDSTVLSASTPITDPMFVYAKYYYTEINTSHPDIANFPQGLSGTLITYRARLNDLWSYQEYHQRNSNRIFRRVWNTSNSTWKSWEVISYNPNTTSLPTALANLRGEFRLVQGGAGVADKLYVCVKLTSEAYMWKEVALV